MNQNELSNRVQLRELIDRFAYLADIKDAAGQGELFTEDGALAFQFGFDGELTEVKGKDNLVEAFSGTLLPCKALYHMNGQHLLTFTDDEHAQGIAYCMATLVTEEDGKEIQMSNSIIYKDEYLKQGDKWLIKKRQSTFILSDRKEK